MNTNDISPDSKIVRDSIPLTFDTGPVQVWLVDDNDKLRRLIAESLENYGGVVCQRHFGSPDAVMSTLASRIGPDVILLDVQMGAQNGLDAIPTIKTLSRSTRVLMLTTCYDPEWHQRAIDSGASGYLLKTDPMERLVGSIRSRGGDSDKSLMRAEPMRIPKIRRQTKCFKEVQMKAPAAKQKPTRFMKWLKSFTKN